MASAPVILVVDDEPDIVESLDFALRRKGYEVRDAYDGETALEVAQRNVEGAGEMPELELSRRAHIDHGDQVVSHASRELLAGYGFEVVAIVEVSRQQLLHLGDVSRCDPSQGSDQFQDRGVGERIVHPRSLFARAQEAGSAQMLEMLGGVGDAKTGDPC